ncbi:MAG TPA: glycoside hydrolase family 2 TIM barrel-domain containing protein [Erysipelothrix sp.]
MKERTKQKNIYQIETYRIPKRALNFNSNWKFSNNESTHECKQSSFNDSNFELINLPHDWSIYYDFNHDSKAQNEAGLLDGGEAWYRKQFIIDQTLANKEFIIRFGGVYMDSNLYVNGKFVGNMPNGYTPFSYNITNYLFTDGRINTIAMKVVNEQPSSRWYSGSGIYRDVHLDIVDAVHFIKEDIVINYTDASDHFITSVKSRLNEAVEGLNLQLTISKKNGEVLYTGSHEWKEKIEVSHDIPQLWSVEQPHLYLMNLKLMHQEELIDEIEIQYGYRFINWTSDEGFFLNGIPTKFHGVCLHHDNGALGARAYYDALKRKLMIMKSMGVNAIRSSHNPCDDKTLRIAEEIGLMVIDESFDTWYWGKKKYDYGRYFELEATHPDAQVNQTWAEFDLKAMVKRGINSPAIIMWSIGNEIGESNDGSFKAIETVKKLNKWVKEVDQTRYTTMGQDVYRWAATGPHENISEVVDAVGLNYAEDSFETIRAKHPDWLIYGSETSSGTRSRGEYAYPDETRSHDNQEIRNFQQSDYGNDHVAWGKTVEQCWLFDKARKDYAGQFFWTGFDYIGEPTPWHNQNHTPATSSYFGIVDTAGFLKNDFYLLQSQWTQEPMVHIYPHWNWENIEQHPLMKTQDNKIPVRVVSNQPYVELYLNDHSLGVKTQAENEVYREWRLDYQPGTLTAIAFDENHIETCRKVIKTANKADKIVIEKDMLSGEQLDYLVITTTDADNNLVPTASHTINFKLLGNAQIVGVDNGNPASMERYQAQHDGSWERSLFNGYALVIVKKNTPDAYYELEASSKELKPALYKSRNIKENIQEMNLSLILDENTLRKHHRVPYEFNLLYKGFEVDLNRIPFTIEYDREVLSLDQNYLYCHQATETIMTLEIPSLSLKEKFTLSIKDDTSVREIDKVHTYPVIIEKDIETLSQFPIYIEFDNGYIKEFLFEILSNIDTRNNHTSTADAYIKDLDFRFKTEVIVESYLSAENFSTVKLENSIANLPEKAHIYHSDGSKHYKDVEWYEEHKDYQLGRIKDTPLISTINIRETTERYDGRNLAQIWTGSQLPLAFASHESNISVNRINNGDFSLENDYHVKNSIGIILGDSGDFTMQYIDNCVLYLKDTNSLDKITIEYLDILPSSIPANTEEAKAFASDDWKQFEIISVTKKENLVRIDLVGQMASAIKITMPKMNVAQIALMEAIPKHYEQARFIIKNGPEIIDSNHLESLTYQYQGHLDIEVYDNSSYTLIEYPDQFIVNIKAEGKSHGTNLKFIK